MYHNESTIAAFKNNRNCVTRANLWFIFSRELQDFMEMMHDLFGIM